MASIAAINDMSGAGKCSLTIVLPVLSAMGHEVHPLPTAILSVHTGYPHYTFLDFTPYMEEYMADWIGHGFRFDSIFSGFLGSVEQIGYIDDFIEKMGQNALTVIDPVMGDGGRAYKTYTPEMCAEMRRLIRRADVITPNLTEAAILLDEPWPEEFSFQKAERWLSALCDMGPKQVVITGIRRGDEWINYAKDGAAGPLLETRNGNAEATYGGTGDLFASVLTGSLLHGVSFSNAVKKATQFAGEAVRYSLENKVPERDGLRFEPLLKNL